MKSHLRKLGIAVIAAALATAAFAAQEAYSLKRVAKVGDTLRYKLEVKVDIMGQEGNLTGSSVQKVTKVDGDTYVVEDSSTGMKINIAGQDQDLPDSSYTSTYNVNNLLVDIKGEGVDDMTRSALYRMESLRSFRAPANPVKAGDTWKVEIKAEPKNGDVAAVMEHTFVAVEKVGTFDAAKIKVVSKETAGGEASGEATIWVDVKDGSVLKAEGRMNKAPFPGAPFPIDATYKLTREGL